MRIKRTSPGTAAAPAAPAAANPLAARRTRLRTKEAERIEAIKESDDQIVECPVQENLLLDIIMRNPRTVRPARPGDYLHVSDLLHRCIRKIALTKKHSIPIRPQRLSHSDVLTFAQGDAIHDALKAMAVGGAPNAVWGNWSCSCGYLFHTEPCTYREIDQDELCPYCGTPTNKYQEVPMHNDALMIVGTPDLLLYLMEFDAFHITELKSISHDQWKELRRPKPEHILQILFYWWLMRELGYRLTDRLSILYATKGYLFAGSPYKEFMFNPEHELHRLEPYFDDARRLLASKTGSTLPARTACSSEMTVEAKSCEVCKICFSKE